MKKQQMCCDIAHDTFVDPQEELFWTDVAIFEWLQCFQYYLAMVVPKIGY